MPLVSSAAKGDIMAKSPMPGDLSAMGNWSLSYHQPPWVPLPHGIDNLYIEKAVVISKG